VANAISMTEKINPKLAKKIEEYKKSGYGGLIPFAFFEQGPEPAGKSTPNLSLASSHQPITVLKKSDRLTLNQEDGKLDAMYVHYYTITAVFFSLLTRDQSGELLPGVTSFFAADFIAPALWYLYSQGNSVEYITTEWMKSEILGSQLTQFENSLLTATLPLDLTGKNVKIWKKSSRSEKKRLEWNELKRIATTEIWIGKILTEFGYAPLEIILYFSDKKGTINMIDMLWKSTK
jgi:hypothetical protein